MQHIVGTRYLLFEGICCASLLMAIRFASRHLRLLLRAYILHHQTSEQGGRWSRRSNSRRSYGNHVTWSKRWTDSAAGDWSYNWPPQVVSHRDECHQDDDRRHHLFRCLLDTTAYLDAFTALTGSCLSTYDTNKLLIYTDDNVIQTMIAVIVCFILCWSVFSVANILMILQVSK